MKVSRFVSGLCFCLCLCSCGSDSNGDSMDVGTAPDDSLDQGPASTAPSSDVDPSSEGTEPEAGALPTGGGGLPVTPEPNPTEPDVSAPSGAGGGTDGGGSSGVSGRGGEAEGGNAGESGSSGAASGGSSGAGLGGSAGNDDPGTPIEEERQSLDAVRQEHGVVALGGELYVLGGFTPDVTSSVQAYDPEADSWRDVADFPELFHHPNVAAVDGLLYVAGFHRGAGLRTADGRTFAYDPDADAWTPRTSLPTGTERGSACTATLDSTIYLFGGASDTTLPDSSAYDTVADEWQQLPPMPELREHCIAAGIHGKVYIVSGRSGGIGGLEPESWVYDPSTQQFEERAPILTPRGGAAGAALLGRIFVFGGEGNTDNADGIFDEVEAYDPETDAWEQLPELLVPRHGYGAATIDDRIYLPGGATGQGFDPVSNLTVFRYE